MTEQTSGSQQQAPSGGSTTAPASASNMYKHASLTGLGGPLFERNQEATVYVGNLEPRVNEEIIWELFLQAGPIVNVHIPRDKVTNEHQSYGFVEFKAEEDADYSIKILHMVKLFNKPIKVNKASQDKRTQEVGAKVFVGNLSEPVDERLLREVFSQFGIVLSSEVKRDQETGRSRRYGFVSFDNFDSSDRAREMMNGQYLQGNRIDVDYAYKKDNQKEKHGSVSERVLAFCQAQRSAQTSAKLTKMFQSELHQRQEDSKAAADHNFQQTQNSGQNSDQYSHHGNNQRPPQGGPLGSQYQQHSQKNHQQHHPASMPSIPQARSNGGHQYNINSQYQHVQHHQYQGHSQQQQQSLYQGGHQQRQQYGGQPNHQQAAHSYNYNQGYQQQQQQQHQYYAASAVQQQQQQQQQPYLGGNGASTAYAQGSQGARTMPPPPPPKMAPPSQPGSST